MTKLSPGLVISSSAPSHSPIIGRWRSINFSLGKTCALWRVHRQSDRIYSTLWMNTISSSSIMRKSKNVSRSCSRKNSSTSYLTRLTRSKTRSQSSHRQSSNWRRRVSWLCQELRFKIVLASFGHFSTSWCLTSSKKNQSLTRLITSTWQVTSRRCPKISRRPSNSLMLWKVWSVESRPSSWGAQKSRY